ncbi:sn-glycerol-1-phosphate dehydrogenase [Shouchella shacheensis]|uniref:sn-glycerol-1-phosphate dehydrogenase n=1 Tax=Shouchella shacheensis TaxID=1649580 RepID=UPI00073FCDC0|nr:sn-glycerol-1-phosphate dehydrogenase [Shouchella shacheensis]
MNLEEVKRRVGQSDYEHYPLPLETIVVEKGALKQAVDYIEGGGVKDVLLVADVNTHLAAGEEVVRLCKGTNVIVKVHLLTPNPQSDVIADEATLVDLLLSVKGETEMLLAVGAGTIHDVVRFVSAKVKRPFLSIPTAPSVDGFTSLGAPLVIKGVKTTYQMVAPVALFADVEVLQQAPTELIAAGFGDMLGKYTSLMDWKVGHLTEGEPYSPLVAELTEEALRSAVDNAEAIGRRSAEGIAILMESLLLSGVAMALFGHSHPASGAEHHLSHYWEMDALKNEKKQMLHGAKVGLSTQVIIDFYKRTIQPQLLQVNQENAEELSSLVESLPEAREIRALLQKVGWSEELVPVDQALIEESLVNAYHLRDRSTLMRCYREAKMKHSL